MRILCEDGPYHGKRVSLKLGDRWPCVVHYEYGVPDIIVGHYSLNYDKGIPVFLWEEEIEALHLPGLSNKTRVCD
jgi:hypothetical protein